MATRQAVVNVQVNAPKTLGQLETELEGINQELKNVAPNSKAFTNLSKQAQSAQKEIGKLGDQIEGSVGTKQAESAKRLGEGLVGGFAAATSAAAFFGAESSEALQKAQANAVLMFTALDGIDKAYKALPASVTNFVGTTIAGFGKALKASKLFSTGTKRALVATGIGIFILALGVVISNWEAINEAVSEFIDSIPFIKNVIKQFNDFKDSLGSVTNVLKAVGAALNAVFELKDPIEAFKTALAEGKKLEDQQENLKKLYTFGNEELERKLKLLQEEGKDQLQIFKIQKQIVKNELNFLKIQKNKGKEQKARIKELDLELELIDIRKGKYDEQQKADTKAGKEKVETEVKVVELKGEDLALQKEISDEIEREVDEQLKLLFVKLQQIESDKERLAIAKEWVRINEERAAAAVFEVEALKEGKEIVAERLFLDGELAALNEEKLDAEERLVTAVGVEAEIKDGIAQLTIEQTKEILEAELALAAVKRDILFIEEQRRALLAEQIAQAGELILGVGDVVTAFLDLRINGLRDNIASIGNELSEIEDKLNDATEKRKATEDLLKDAQGERFTELLANLDEEKKEEDDLTAQKELALKTEAQLEYQLALAEWKANIITATQAALQTGIQTALAIVKALPNIPLSIAVGAIGAGLTTAAIGQISQISSNKPQEPTGFDEGGFTGEGGKYEAAGIVHKGEWVANQELLANPFAAQMVQLLDSMRLGMKGYADGGFTSAPAPNTGLPTLTTQLDNQAIEVSVVEISRVANNVKVIETKSSI